MKKIITLLTLAFFISTNAQTYVGIPDSNFVHYLKTIVPTAFKGDSLNTSSTLITTTTHTINVRAKGISNMSGVQYFTSLTYLDCSQNTITNLPSIANSITWLWCSNNSLTSLPALPNPLQILFADTNQLSSVPSLPNGLISFYVGRNNLTSLPTLPNSINYMGCDYNNLTNLPTLPTSLTYLYCYNNYLTSLPALPSSLTRLECEENNLTSLPDLPSGLQTFYCDRNNITCFPTLPNSITSPYFNIDPNPYNCLPNYISAMNSTDLAVPLCAAGNSNGCPVAAAGIEQFVNNDERMNIYPNPNNGSFVIEPSNATKQTMQVYDVNGKMVLCQSINGKTSIDASSLSEGVYNISLISNEVVVNKRLVIVK